VDVEEIEFTMKECEKMVGCEILKESHSQLADFCSRLATWITRSIEVKTDYNDYNSSSRVWRGTAGMAEWNELVFPPADYTSIKHHLQAAIDEQKLVTEEQEAGFEDATPALSKKALDCIEGIFSILEYMYVKDSVYRDDYRMAVVQTQTRKRGGTGWLKKGRNDGTTLVKVITLHFWCLNPGVCFDELKNDCRSIVLTSGTLSPIVTFASELDVKFPITLEADHVIDRKQVWVATLSHGPSGHNLNATYKNTETLSFQDEVGRLVLNVCVRVPHGVLVFLPSYKMLDNLRQRWQSTGTWAEIMTKKNIVCEPKFSDQLDQVMKEFYDAVAINTDQEGQNGALFLAVCRGKVSEGLDFADNNARAVICVGIPFPNIKDTLVDLKKRYNDNKRNTQDPNILSGSEWYEIQAFRALNQALGRCIRHRKDWGAIIMVDDRYARNERYVNGLSKWVRKNVNHFSSCGNMFNHLETFVKDMKQFDKEEQELQLQAEALKQIEDNNDKQVNSEVTNDDTIDTAIPTVTSAWKKPLDNVDANETLSAKLAKLQEFKRYVPNKLASHSTTSTSINLDTSTHLNKGGDYLINQTNSNTNGNFEVDHDEDDDREIDFYKRRRQRKPRAPRKPRTPRVRKNQLTPKVEKGPLDNHFRANTSIDLMDKTCDNEMKVGTDLEVNDMKIISTKEKIENAKRKFVGSSESSGGLNSSPLKNGQPKLFKGGCDDEAVSVSDQGDIKVDCNKEESSHKENPIVIDSDSDEIFSCQMKPVDSSDSLMKKAFEEKKRLASKEFFQNSDDDEKVPNEKGESLSKTELPVESQNLAKYADNNCSISFSDAFNSPLTVSANSSTTNVNVNEIMLEDSKNNEKWINIIKKRKEKRGSKEKDVEKTDFVPHTNKAVEREDNGSNIDWDEDIFFSSDDDLCAALDNQKRDVVEDKENKEAAKVLPLRKPLFARKESTPLPPLVPNRSRPVSLLDGISFDSAMDVSKVNTSSSSATDTSLNRSESKKKRKKKNSKDSSFSRASRIPIIEGNSDDDFK